MQRRLYLVGYDISNQKRVKHALNIVRDYASGGQYSAYECYLSSAEMVELIERMVRMMKGNDGLFIILLPYLSHVDTLGIAQLPIDETIFILN